MKLKKKQDITILGIEQVYQTTKQNQEKEKHWNPLNCWNDHSEETRHFDAGTKAPILIAAT